MTSPAPDTHTPIPTTASELRDAVTDLFPALVAAAPIGLLYGAIAVSKGMSQLEVVLSSALIFAGGLQLAAIELWTYPVPLLALFTAAVLINARYVLMSTSIAPKLAHLPFGGKFLGFHVLADENWALAERRAASRTVTGAYFFGMGAIFFANWILFSWLGTVVGPALGDPKRFGADFAFTAIFIGLVAGFVKRKADVMVVAVAAIAAAGAHLLVGSPWHVMAGALAGIGTAALAHKPTEARA